MSLNEPIEKVHYYDYELVFGGLDSSPQHEIVVSRAS
jgi:hypothetical protein